MTGAKLEPLLSAKEIVVTCGAGGVGKTTVAAAAAASAAVHQGGRVLALTVDPARRLAGALGLERFGNIETRVDPATFEACGVSARGELWVAMLDTKASWDELVHEHAPDETTREAILANPLYRNVTGKFVHSHDYIAMERLHEIHTSGRYDLIVVDTPPSGSAIDFLDAPERMAEFFSSRLLRWLIAPYRSRVMTAASRPFFTAADRVLGAEFLHDVADFFILFQTMYGGFVERARAVTRTLADRRTTFVVVTTLDPAPVREAEFFGRELAARRYHLGAAVLNRTLPEWLTDRHGLTAAESMSSAAGELAAELAGVLALDPDDRGALAGVLAEVAESYRNHRLVATREAERRSELDLDPGLVVAVPELAGDVASLADVLEVGAHLW